MKTKFNQVSLEKWEEIKAHAQTAQKENHNNILWEKLYNKTSRHFASYNTKLKRVYTDGGDDITKVVTTVISFN